MSKTSLNQLLSNAASRKLSVNRQHEQVQILTGRNCRPFTELRIECFQQGEDGQKSRTDLFQVQRRRGSEIIGKENAGQLSRVPAPRDKRKFLCNSSGRKRFKKLFQIAEGKVHRHGRRFGLAEHSGEQTNNFLRIERFRYFVAQRFLAWHIQFASGG